MHMTKEKALNCKIFQNFYAHSSVRVSSLSGLFGYRTKEGRLRVLLQRRLRLISGKEKIDTSRKK